MLIHTPTLFHPCLPRQLCKGEGGQALLLGCGPQAAVYRGQLGGKEVAVKVGACEGEGAVEQYVQGVSWEARWLQTRWVRAGGCW